LVPGTSLMSLSTSFEVPSSEVGDQFDDDDEETAAEEEGEDEEEDGSEDQETGDDESSSCMEEEEKYADQPAAGLSPRKVLKRAMATLKDDEERGNVAKRLQRIDTFSDFERTVDTGEEPITVGLHRVDTFGQSMNTSAEAAARARLGTGRPPACPALARLAQNCSTGANPPLHRIPSDVGQLRALPEVEDALQAVDGEGATEPGEYYPTTEARTLPAVRMDTLDLLQHPSHPRTASIDESSR